MHRSIAADRHALRDLCALVAAEMAALAPAPGVALAGAGAAAPQSPGFRSGLLAMGRAGTAETPDTRGGGEPDDEDPERVRLTALVTLAQRGDAEAFGQIYDLYVDAVYRYLYYRVGSPTLAEDLTSETFLRALRRIDSFSWQGKDIGAWFVTIARNLVSDHFKSSRFRLEVPTGDILDADRADGGIEDVVVDRLESAELLKAVRELKPEQQECIVLRFLQGLSVAETAKVMQRSDGAVKQLQLRAIRALARLVPARSS